jgi:hypothetical protein
LACEHGHRRRKGSREKGIKSVDSNNGMNHGRWRVSLHCVEGCKHCIVGFLEGPCIVLAERPWLGAGVDGCTLEQLLEMGVPIGVKAAHGDPFAGTNYGLLVSPVSCEGIRCSMRCNGFGAWRLKKRRRSGVNSPRT